MRALDNVIAWFTREDRLIAAAVLRVGLGAVILSLYLLHYHHRDYIWGPNAFISHEMFSSVENVGNYSLYLLSGSRRAFELIFHAGIVVTALWTLGVFTRLTGIATYVFSFSLWQRNHYILDGGDNILIVCLLFLVFARTDRHLSVTRWLRARRGTPAAAAPVKEVRFARARDLLYQAGTVLHNFLMTAIVVQLAFLYLTSALYKVQGEMWQSGVALYYVLRVQEFTFPGVSHFIYENALLVVAMSYMTVLEQLAYPFMLLNKWTKRLSVLVVVQMHLGIGLLMGLASFSTVMITLQAAAFRDEEFRGALRLVRSARSRAVLAVYAAMETLYRPLRPRLAPPLARLRAAASVTVYYDAWCPTCAGIRARVERLDALGLVTFTSLRLAGVEQEAGVPAERLAARMHLRRASGGGVCSGAAAMAALAARVPALMPLWPVLAAASRLGVGEWVYDGVARRRTLLPAGVCDVAGCTPGAAS